MITRTGAFAQEHIVLKADKLKAGSQRGGAAIGNGPELQDTLVAQQNRFEQFFSSNQTHLVQANKLIAGAAAKLQSGATKETIDNQHQAGEVLRYLLVAYINELLLPPGPGSASDPVAVPPSESSLVDDMTMYMPGAVSGDKVKGGRQEWEVLGQRDRAALNENFARELPLEYRAILKDYYERLAQ